MSTTETLVITSDHRAEFSVRGCVTKTEQTAEGFTAVTIARADGVIVEVRIRGPRTTDEHLAVEAARFDEQGEL